MDVFNARDWARLEARIANVDAALDRAVTVTGMQ
jgi:hypothetical protein